MIYKVEENKLNEDNKEKVTKELMECVNNLKENEELIADLEKVKYISSAGLIPLMIIEKESQERNFEFSTINVQPMALNIFRLTGLNQFFIKDDKRDAKLK